MAKPSYCFTSNTGRECIFKIEEMQLTALYHQLTPSALEALNHAAMKTIPRFNYMERHMNWEFIKINSSNHRFRLEPTMLSHGQLPERVFLTMCRANSFVGNYKNHGGWMDGELVTTDSM